MEAGEAPSGKKPKPKRPTARKGGAIPGQTDEKKPTRKRKSDKQDNGDKAVKKAAKGRKKRTERKKRADKADKGKGKMHGRKNIRDVMDESVLTESALQARRAEEERQKRIEARKAQAHSTPAIPKKPTSTAAPAPVKLPPKPAVIPTKTISLIESSEESSDEDSESETNLSNSSSSSSDDVSDDAYGEELSESGEESSDNDEADIIHWRASTYFEPVESSGDESSSSDDEGAEAKNLLLRLDTGARITRHTLRVLETEPEALEAINSVVSVPEETPAPEILINVNHDPTEPDIMLVPEIARIIKPHQIQGVRFMWDNVIESLELVKSSSGFGCLLAHEMGLGKTLQAITFIQCALSHTTLRTALVLVPVNCLENWGMEFFTWLKPEHRLKVYNLELCKHHHSRARMVERWQSKGGVMLIGHEFYRKLTTVRTGKAGEYFETVVKALQSPGPDIVIVDEGHRIKNDSTGLNKALKGIQTRRRIVLTGYPLQNNLLEYYCMVDFVRPNFLGTVNNFRNMFMNPIINGQCMDSTPLDVKKMRYRAHVLTSLLKPFVQRMDHRLLRSNLPGKVEYVVSVRLSALQRRLYTAFLAYRNSMKGVFTGGQRSQFGLFECYALLTKVWNHPDTLFAAVSEKQAELMEGDEDKLEAIEEDGGVAPAATVAPTDIQQAASRMRLEKLWGWVSLANENANSNLDQLQTDSARAYQLAVDAANRHEHGIIEHSGMGEMLLPRIMKGDRVLLFSQSLRLLDVLEEVLSKQKVPGQKHRWRKGSDYFRLDGSTDYAQRQRDIDRFNTSRQAWLYLISTRAGGLGVNLTGANRVVIFDASWNPSHDVQAMFRAYRYGQRKKVHVYRLVAAGTMEQKIYDRQVTKQGLANRVVDEQNPHRYMATTEFEDLFTYTEFPAAPLPKDEFNDDVLEPVCHANTEWVANFHVHDSLLMDNEDEQITEAESALAVAEYERDKSEAALRGSATSLVRQRTVLSLQQLQQLNADRAEAKAQAEFAKREAALQQEQYEQAQQAMQQQAMQQMQPQILQPVYEVYTQPSMSVMPAMGVQLAPMQEQHLVMPSSSGPHSSPHPPSVSATAAVMNGADVTVQPPQAPPSAAPPAPLAMVPQQLRAVAEREDLLYVPEQGMYAVKAGVQLHQMPDGTIVVIIRSESDTNEFLYQPICGVQQF